MLHRVMEYAEQHGLKAEPGFAVKQVRWALSFDRQGKFLGCVELGRVGDKRNPGREFAKCPYLSQPEMKAGGETKAHFLVETAEVVALHSKKPDDKKVQAKHAYFVKLLEQASQAMPLLAGPARTLGDDAQLEAIRAELAAAKVKPNDKLTLEIDGVFPLERTDWHDWWRQFLRELDAGRQKKPTRKKAGSQRLMLDLITGRPVEPVANHNKIKGLAGVGGQSSGDALASFKQESFQSFGLEKALNSAMSEQTMVTYVETLNRLIREQGHSLAGVRLVYWFKKQVPPEDDPLSSLMEPPAEQQESQALHRMRRLLQAIEQGRRPDLASNQYYALALSGAAGRVMVRDWIEGAFPELVRNVRDWFQHLEIVHRQGGAPAPLPKLWSLVAALVREMNDENKKRINQLAAGLWRAALKNQPLPQAVPALALQRVRVDIINDDPPSHTRMALLKAYIVRNQGDEQMKTYLNPEHPDPAYHCGRLMAVYANLQKSALGDVGAGVVQRYYAAASTTPALVLGRLARLGQFHLNKLENPGLAHWYEDQIAGIMAHLKDEIPQTLDLKEQSLFALGYYQQLAHMRTKKSDQPEGEENSGQDQQD